jgi:hypothetical protein
MLKKKVFDIIKRNGCLNYIEEQNIARIEEEEILNIQDMVDLHLASYLAVKNLQTDLKTMKHYYKQIKKATDKKLKCNGVR